MTVTCVVVVTVVGTGQVVPDWIGLPERLEGPTGRVALEIGYGAPTVAEENGRPVPVPVPVCAVAEAERAKMLARVVKRVSGAIAMSGIDLVAGVLGIRRCKPMTGRG